MNPDFDHGITAKDELRLYEMARDSREAELDF